MQPDRPVLSDRFARQVSITMIESVPDGALAIAPHNGTRLGM
jgi:hypothetical protein